MLKKNLPLFVIAAIFMTFTLSPLFAQGSGLVQVLVNAEIYSSLSEHIAEYESDLENEGYTVEVTAQAWDGAEEIRAFLQTQYENGLVGAVFVGKLPMAMFNVPRNLHESYRHDFETPLYFMDLDGAWGGEDQGVFTSHNGDTQAEIWTGFIRADNLQELGDETTLLKKYFEKIHNYRLGNHYAPPRRAFRFYYTIKPNYQNLESIYFEIFDSGCNVSADQLKSIFDDEEGYEFAVVNTSSGASVHHFHHQPFWPLPEAYWSEHHTSQSTEPVVDCEDDCDVSWRNVQEANPKILFYHLATSETGRFDHENSLSGSYTFGTDYGLATLAAAQHTIIGDHFYQPLADGATFGEAYLQDMNKFIDDFEAGGNTSTVWCPDWDFTNGKAEKLTQSFYAAVIVGDPTLTLPKSPLSSVEESQPEQPAAFALSESYPNPFSIGSETRLQLHGDAFVSAKVYDVAGRIVAEILDGNLQRGEHVLRWNGTSVQRSKLANGVYFLAVSVQDRAGFRFRQARRLLLMR